MTLPLLLFFAVILGLAVLVLLVVYCRQLSRVVKKLREKDGEAVLRENKRTVLALTALCVCWLAAGALFHYGVMQDASIPWCLLNGVKETLLLAGSGAWACHRLQKAGMALKEENQPDLGE